MVEEIIYQTSLLYSSQESFLFFKKAVLDFAILTKTLGDENNNKINFISIDHLRLAGDENMQIGVNRGLQFSDRKVLPNDKLSSELTNHRYLVYKLSFLLPDTIIKIIENIIEGRKNKLTKDKL